MLKMCQMWKIEIVEMDFLRYVASRTLLDKKRNEEDISSGFIGIQPTRYHETIEKIMEHMNVMEK